MPDPILGRSYEWLELPLLEKASSHSRQFRGRSFIRIFLSIPELTKDQMYRVWSDLHGEHGYDLFGGTSTVPAIAPGTQLTLIRSAGVLLTDLSYADSGIVESVTTRVFRYPRHTLDLSTSDYFGTLHFVQELKRRDLLSRTRNGLGLVRVDDADPTFFGLLSGAPDPLRSSSNALTTVRNNCVTCHSLIQYGWRSVFSMGLMPERRTGRESTLEGGLLNVISPERYILNTEEFSEAIRRGKLFRATCLNAGEEPAP